MSTINILRTDFVDISLYKKVSRDGGITFHQEKTQQLMSEIFYMSSDHTVEFRYLFNIIDASSTFGGLYGTFILPVFYIVGSYINSVIMKAKLIRALFLQKRENVHKVITKVPATNEIIETEPVDIREELDPIKFSV